MSKRILCDQNYQGASRITNLPAPAADTEPLRLGDYAVRRVAAVTIDCNIDTAQTLYTVPTGKTFVPLHVFALNLVGNTDPVPYSIGFNAGADNLVNGGIFDAPSPQVVDLIFGAIPSLTGAAGETLKIKVSTPVGAMSSATIHVVGYLF